MPGGTITVSVALLVTLPATLVATMEYVVSSAGYCAPKMVREAVVWPESSTPFLYHWIAGAGTPATEALNVASLFWITLWLFTPVMVGAMLPALIVTVATWLVVDP